VDQEQLQAKLLEYLTALEAGIKQGGDFVAEQTPLVVQEFLAWMFAEAVIYAVVSFIVFVIALRLLKLLWVHTADFHHEDREFCRAFGTFGLSVVAILSCGVAVHQSTRAIKVSVAPRVVVLEKSAELIKEIRK